MRSINVLRAVPLPFTPTLVYRDDEASRVQQSDNLVNERLESAFSRFPLIKYFCCTEINKRIDIAGTGSNCTISARKASRLSARATAEGACSLQSITLVLSYTFYLREHLFIACSMEGAPHGNFPALNFRDIPCR